MKFQRRGSIHLMGVSQFRDKHRTNTIYIIRKFSLELGSNVQDDILNEL